MNNFEYFPQTSRGSFSAVTKPIFASKYSLESSRRDLHSALLCTALQCHFFVMISQKILNFAKFSKFSKNSENFRKILAIFQKRCDFRVVQRSALYRFWRELSNAFLLAKIGFDTAEIEPDLIF